MINESETKTLYNGRYEIVEQLGKGGFGLVFKVKDVKDINEPIKAMKKINISNEDSIIEEINILLKLKSHYVVNYFEYFEYQIYLLLIFEYCTKGDLGQVITIYKKDAKRLYEGIIKKWSLEILDALDFLHSNNVVHFDIKPDNIFLDELERVKIGDLGLARSYESLCEMTEMRGTMCYMCPEVLQINEHATVIDFKADIWSFGCVLYEMIMLEKAFYDDNELKLQHKITNEEIDLNSIDMSADYKFIIQKCLSIDKNKRFSSGELKKILRSRESKLQQLYDTSTGQLSTIPNEHTAELYNKLGMIQLENGNYANALTNFQKSLKLKEQLCNDDETAVCLNNIASSHKLLGDYSNALVFYTKSYEIYQKLYPSSVCHPSIAMCLDNIGNTHLNLGHVDEGMKFMMKSLEMRRQLYPAGDHLEIANSLNNIASGYGQIGDRQNELKYLKESLELLTKLHPDDHANIAMCLSNMGDCYRMLDDCEYGLSLLKKSLEMLKRLYTNDHPNIAICLNLIACVYHDLGDYHSSLKFGLESLNMSCKIYASTNHPQVASSFYTVALAYHQIGDYQNALVNKMKALEIYRKLYNGDHKLIADLLRSIASTYTCLGGYSIYIEKRPK